MSKPKQQSRKKCNHTVRRANTAASGGKSNIAASCGRNQNNNQPLQPVVCKEKKKQQSTCELGASRANKNNNLSASREKQQSTCARGRKETKNTKQQFLGVAYCGRNKKNNKAKQQSSCVAACHGRKQENKTTIKLCGPLTAARGKRAINLCVLSSARRRKNDNQPVSWVRVEQTKTTISPQTGEKQSTCACSRKGGTTINRCGRNNTWLQQKTKTTINLFLVRKTKS